MTKRKPTLPAEGTYLLSQDFSPVFGKTRITTFPKGTRVSVRRNGDVALSTHYLDAASAWAEGIRPLLVTGAEFVAQYKSAANLFADLLLAGSVDLGYLSILEGSGSYQRTSREVSRARVVDVTDTEPEPTG